MARSFHPRGGFYWQWIRWAAVAVALALVAGFAPQTGAAERGVVTVEIPVGAPEFVGTPDGDVPTVEGFGRLLIPGKPNLPGKIFALAIPPGAEFAGLRYETGTPIVLDGIYVVPPAPLPRVIGDEDPVIAGAQQKSYDENYAAVYGSDDAYPAQPADFVRTAGYRRYNLVDVRIAPLAYHPQSGRLVYYPDITVHVDYVLSKSASSIADGLPRTEAIARDIVLNYDEAQTWYPPVRFPERGLYDFVIITLDSLTTSVQPLVDWETYKGRTASVVTTTWINSNYSGYDLAEKMRNFLRDKYPAGEWGIQDVLLVGHYDNVPMRRCAQNLGYGTPETDFYYAELTSPDSSSWDSDGDHQWGEDSDTLDFYNEVNVGRIPWSTPATVLSICNKSVAYEQNQDPTFKKNILLLGAFFWDNDPNPRTDNAVLMEAKVNQPWMADWAKTRMYEQGYSTYPMDYNLNYANVAAVWSAGKYAFVNWAGHGSPTSSHIYHGTVEAFVSTSTCPQLNDNYPAIIFADACSNSDTDETNIGQVMLQRGGVGFVGATKVALGCPGWTGPLDGSSQSLDYYFTTMVTSGDYSIGEAHQQALRNMYLNGLWGYLKYETFEWGALWGNPDLGMGPPPGLCITFPEGLPELVPPGTATQITVQVAAGVDTYIEDSATLYYRYDGGAFATVPLTPLGADLYRATLPPAYCDDVPEYYFSAEGVDCGVIHSPAGAPASVYSFGVGERTVFFEDDFQTNQGWTVYAGATTGNWERADPAYTSYDIYDPVQPGDDHSPDGTLCYVTQAAAGSSAGSYDVDGGPTWLLSPTLALAGQDAYISYWRWFHISTVWDDQLTVAITNDGSNWVTVETIANREEWRQIEFRVSDFVTPTDNVQVRFWIADTGSGSLIEALVDDFAVEVVSCTPPDYEPGDLNCDHFVNNSDIPAFVLALTERAAYEAQYPGCDADQVGDLNGDGVMNNADIPRFVDLLTGG